LKPSYCIFYFYIYTTTTQLQPKEAAQYLIAYCRRYSNLTLRSKSTTVNMQADPNINPDDQPQREPAPDPDLDPEVLDNDDDDNDPHAQAMHGALR
jgi:hypothetical protein